MPSSRIAWSLAAAACLACPATFAVQFVEQTSTNFPIPNPSEYTNQSTIGDIDGDGDLDLLFANGQGFGAPPGAALPVRVFINNGSGIFTDESSARTGGLTGWHRGVELGDCDLDGDLDVILTQDFAKLPNLLINNGNGLFTAEGATRLPNLVLSSSRGQFGDVDNDGDLDLFLTNGGSTAGSDRFGCAQYQLYLNDGTCHYTSATATNLPAQNTCENQDCIFGDIDNDFDIDIRTASTGTNNSRLYRNDGTGVFSFVTTPADSTTYSYDFGDIDGDGDLDMLGINGGPGSAEILLQNDGTGGYTDVSGQISPNPSQDDNDSKFFDFDNDGDLDLIIGRISGAEKLYRNNGTGSFVQVSGEITAVTDSTLDVDVADLDGDGDCDVVTAQGESGNFQDRIYVNGGVPDTLAPRIIDTEEVASPDGAGPYAVRALILDDMTSDRNFFDHGISLNYTVNAGPPQEVPMRHSGGQVYRGEIPGQAGGASVEYWVEATDFNDNTATGPTQSFVVPDCTGVGNCSGHGTCTGINLCDCDPGWSGADCSVELVLPGGTVPDGSTPDPPLRISKLSGGTIIRLNWGASCGPDDDDYAVYVGALGNFTSHVPLTCSTSGLLGITTPATALNEYYLSVPTTLNREGSYGLDGNGAERPPSASACAPQSVATCP